MFEQGWTNQKPAPEEAVKWYEKAMDSDGRNEARADPQYRLGRMYERGWNGRKSEPEKAMELYHKAARPRADGNARPGPDEPDPDARSSLWAQACARYRLGWMYEMGCDGEKPDEKEAVNWYRNG